MTISVIGKVLLATGVILAHSELEHEKRVDDEVIRSFHRERILTLIGIILIVIGYVIEVQFFGGFENMLTCKGGNCQATLIEAYTQ